MPNKRQAEKRARRDEKRAERNRLHISRMRTAIRNFKKLLAKKDIESLKEAYPKVVSIIQHTAAKHVIHKNEAARRVSRITKAYNEVLKSLTASNE